MPFEAGLAAYAGFAGIAAAMSRHRPRPGRIPLPHPPYARGFGATLLALALLLAVRRFGLEHGLVVGVVQICLAAVMLVLLMSWRPRAAFALALPAFALAVLLVALI